MSTRLAAAALAAALAAGSFVSPWAATAFADVGPVGRHVPDAALVGEGRLKVMLWKVFDARLDAPAGRYAADAPFALSLSYLRSLDAGQIVDASIKEMAEQSEVDAETLATWRTWLADIIPDVTIGTVVTGVRDARGHALFYRDGQPIGQVADPAFTRAFFDIWLGEDSSQPKLRERLLAGTAS